MKKRVNFFEKSTLQSINFIGTEKIEKSIVKRNKGYKDFIKMLQYKDIFIMSKKEYQFDKIDIPDNKYMNKEKKSILKYFCIKNKINVNRVDLLFKVNPDYSYCYFACLKKEAVSKNIQLFKDKLNIHLSCVIPEHFCWLGLSNLYGISNYVFLEEQEDVCTFFIVNNSTIVEKYTINSLDIEEMRYHINKFKENKYNIFCLSNKIKKKFKNNLHIKNIKDELKEIYSIPFDLTDIDCMAILSICLLKTRSSVKLYTLRPVLYKSKPLMVILSITVPMLLAILIINIMLKVYIYIDNSSVLVNINTSLISNIKKLSLEVNNLQDEYRNNKVFGKLDKKYIDRTEYFMPVLSVLTNKAHPGTWLNDITIYYKDINSDTIILGGEGLSREEIMVFYQYLKKTSLLKNIDIKKIKERDSGTYFFVFGI